MPEPDSPNELVKKLDAGNFDGQVMREFQKLSTEQLEEIARIVLERHKRETALAQIRPHKL